MMTLMHKYRMLHSTNKQLISFQSSPPLSGK